MSKKANLIQDFENINMIDTCTLINAYLIYLIQIELISKAYIYIYKIYILQIWNFKKICTKNKYIIYLKLSNNNQPTIILHTGKRNQPIRE